MDISHKEYLTALEVANEYQLQNKGAGRILISDWLKTQSNVDARLLTGLNSTGPEYMDELYKKNFLRIRNVGKKSWDILSKMMMDSGMGLPYEVPSGRLNNIEKIVIKVEKTKLDDLTEDILKYLADIDKVIFGSSLDCHDYERNCNLELDKLNDLCHLFFREINTYSGRFSQKEKNLIKSIESTFSVLLKSGRGGMICHVMNDNDEDEIQANFEIVRYIKSKFDNEMEYFLEKQERIGLV